MIGTTGLGRHARRTVRPRCEALRSVCRSLCSEVGPRWMLATWSPAKPNEAGAPVPEGEQAPARDVTTTL